MHILSFTNNIFCLLLIHTPTCIELKVKASRTKFHLSLTRQHEPFYDLPNPEHFSSPQQNAHWGSTRKSIDERKTGVFCMHALESRYISSLEKEVGTDRIPHTRNKRGASEEGVRFSQPVVSGRQGRRQSCPVCLC